MATLYSDILEAAKAALLAIVTNKVASYELEGTRYSYHNLDDLRRMIKDLEVLAAEEANPRNVVLLGDFSRGGR